MTPPSGSSDGAEPSFISLFSGAGGMDVGLEEAGFRPLACYEVDSLARETLAANRPEWPLADEGDVVAFASGSMPSDFGIEPGELDLVAGGPPCQPFSKAGQWTSSARLGMDDVRAQTIHALLDIFKNFRPKVLLLENVQGFVSGKSAAIGEIRRVVSEVNRDFGTQYVVEYRIVNAADYGVPQNRVRAMVIVHDGLSFSWPTETHRDKPTTAWDALSLVPTESDLPATRGKWAGLLPSIPEGTNYQWLTSEGGGPALFGYRTRYWSFLLKLAKDKPSWTLPASPGPATGPFHWDNRPLTIAERMRIQTFPARWVLKGSYREQMRQVGNATPPLLAEVFGRAVRSALGLQPLGGEPHLAIASANTPPAPTPPAPLPREFARFIGTYDAHRGTGKGPAPRDTNAQTRPPALSRAEPSVETRERAKGQANSV